MGSNSIRNPLVHLAAAALLSVPAQAATSFSAATGYVRVTIPGDSLGTLSATLQNKSEHTSNATVNDDWQPLDNNGTPLNTNDDIPAQQTLTVSGAGWTDDQWIASAYLCYVVDSNGGEEAFLILDNDSETITIQCDFDLLDASRDIPGTASISIRRAQTIGGLFGTGANTDFTQEDRVYIWNGVNWIIYSLDASFNWKRTGSFFANNDDAVFPDEGIFIQRNDATDLTVTFFGDVPGKAQMTTIPGPGLQFVSTRYPVQTTIGQLGFENLPNWQNSSSGDLVYVWSGTAWIIYWHTAGGWMKAGDFLPNNDAPIAPDSAVFVSRKSASGLPESANRHELPYTP